MSSEERPPELVAHYCLVDGVAAWILAKENAWWVAEAADQFFLWDDGYRESEMEWLSVLFAVWLIYDYQSPAGEIAIGRYLKARGSGLSTPDRERLRRLERDITAGTDPGRFCLVAVEEVRLDEGLSLRDLMTGERLKVRERAGSHRVHPQDTLIVRTRHFPGYVVLDHAMLVPSATRQAILEGIGVMLRELQRDSPELEPTDLFRRRAPHVFHLCLPRRVSARSPNLVTADGDPLLICRAHHRLADVEALRLSLRAHRSFSELSPDRFVWMSGTKRKGPLAGRRIALGCVLLEGDRLVLETQSRPRLRRGCRLLASIAGPLVTHLLDEFCDAERAFSGELASKSIAAGTDEGARAPGVHLDGDRAYLARRNQVEQHVSEHVRRWLDRPLSTLNGLSPRQAVRLPAQRHRLVTLLRELEQRLASDPAPPLNVDDIRRELDIRPDE